MLMPKKMDLLGEPKPKEVIILYHGSTESSLVPVYGKGLAKNDYGQGFYTTRGFDLACEWACSRTWNTRTPNVGFVYKYELDTTGLDIFDFRKVEKNRTLIWITKLLQYRTFEDAEDYDYVTEFLREHFSVDTEDKDVVVGLRADDSYFQFARAFLQNRIGLTQLSTCLELGDLGVQYCIKSEKAFNQLRSIGCTPITHTAFRDYQDRFHKRDTHARDTAKTLIRDTIRNIKSSLTINDIIRNWR